MWFKCFIFKILFACFCFIANSQYPEIGFFGGGSNFIGDVGEYTIHLPKGYALGAFFRYNFDRYWAVRAHLNYGCIRNADSLSNWPSRVNRNLHFESPIWEGTVLAEFNFLEFEPGTKHNHTPYILGGFGIFSFNPKAIYQGKTYELQKLGTEGQGTSENDNAHYSLASSFFEFGVGYKFSIGPFTSLGIESTFRRTSTDYLDDASGLYADFHIIAGENMDIAAALSDRSLIDSDKEGVYRGNPANNDWYIFTGITFQFMFDDLYEKCVTFVGQ